MQPIPTPPKDFVDAIGGNFTSVGRSLFTLIREQCDVLPTDAVLDIGSGCGRVAVPFTEYLTTGTYVGLDIVLPMVEWCRANISSRYPQFSFEHADVSNTFYSKTGADAASYTFPFPDNSFDVVFATSVFTHLVPASARRYAAEIARVLKGDGRALVTFFLLKGDSEIKVPAGPPPAALPYRRDGYALSDEHRPEAAIAYDEAVAIAILERESLAIERLIYGFQDVLVLSKRTEEPANQKLA